MKRAFVAIIIVAAGLLLARAHWQDSNFMEYQPPPERDLELVDDTIVEKNPRFDPEFVDSRPLGGWEVNASAAVIRLDSPPVKPDKEEKLLELRPTYMHAMKTARTLGLEMLPSANLIDGKGKQFDDGLYAALDLACFRGELGLSPAAPALVRRIFDRLPAGSPARPFLGAALDLAGERPDLDRAEAKEANKLLEGFEADEARSKPISFYTWTHDLVRVWRFFRFLQREFEEDASATPRAVAAVLRADPALREQYRALNAFYGRLTNPLACLPADLLEEGVPLATAAARNRTRRPTAAIFPPSTSRETELFEALFPLGIPPSTNLMNELVRRIRTGEVDLVPDTDGGWYQHQVYALETLLLPTRGEEQEKLLLTAHYKRRLVEAFKALMTKRRETHARQLRIGEAMAPAPPPAPPRSQVQVRLRLEPSVSFYLRTARAYAFLEDFLTAAVGRERLTQLRGLREGGEREKALAAELTAMRRLFYGFYLVACEDIGLRPRFLKGELVNEAVAKSDALAWLDTYAADPDLALDTRGSVPIHRDSVRDVTRLWATLGVRLAKLEASYATAPMIRPSASSGWQEVNGTLKPSAYVIAVDEFAEIELKGSSALTRDELRKVCDKRKTREKILAALAKR